jgi:predicted dehydrogenase
MNTTRRSFIQASAAAGAALGLAPHLLFSRDGAPPSEQLHVGLVGCGSKGRENLEVHLRQKGLRCAGVCDVDRSAAEAMAARVQENFGEKPAIYGDYRRLLEHPDLDIVIVATPDHWHCLPTVHACEAGRDVYVEKPLANSIAECNAMVRAARRHGRVVQVGQQQRSGDTWVALMELLHGDTLGRLRKVNLWANFNYGVGLARVPDGPVPPGVDFDFWLGPAPARAFNAARFHDSWRMFWDHGGGLMTDWGVHLIDMALWAGRQQGDPTEVLAWGRNLAFPEFDHETYDTMSAIFPMDSYVINWQHAAGLQAGPYNKLYGAEFVCDHGTIVADRGGWKMQREEPGTVPHPATRPKSFVTASQDQAMEAHVADFVSCVKSRREPACPIETGRQVAVFSHAANIAVRSGAGRLLWDAAKGRFSNSDAANRFITPEYRRPWVLPEA